MFIDTHVHLNDDIILTNIDKVLNDALSNNVKKFIVVGSDLEQSYLAVQIASRYSFCYAVVGFHPTEIKNYTNKEYEELELLAKNQKVVGLGECGYDFHYDTTTVEEQKDSFVRQIEIAKRLNKPLIIHSRDAIELTYKTLLEYDASLVGGVIHSYSGSLEMAKKFIKLNFMIGVSGVVTFKNAKSIVQTVKEVSIDNLLTETDSPYLSPEPFRGKVNGPKNIPYIAKKISELKGISLDELESQIEKNVKKRFGI